MISHFLQKMCDGQPPFADIYGNLLHLLVRYGNQLQYGYNMTAISVVQLLFGDGCYD